MKCKNNAKRIHFDSIPSTQDYAKSQRGNGRDLVVTATSQSGGKGTKGRSFSSDVGGVYLTKLSFYEDFPAKQAFLVMASAAVAVCETLRFYGIKPLIKWPNDIFVDDKKICGILIENVFSGGNISSSMVGIGLNVCNPLPEELQSIATTMLQVTGELYSVEEVTNRLIAELDKARTMAEYRGYMGYMGRQANLLFGDELVPGTLVCVDDEGGLTVEIDGMKRRVTAGEVSVRI